MRKQTFFFCLLLAPALLPAQVFSKAPKNMPDVRKIVEWTTFAATREEPEETIRDAVYFFQPDGKLEKWISNNNYEEIYHYKYDDKGRLSKVIIENGDSSRLLTYQYFDDRQMAEIEERNLDLRTIQYFNKKKQIIEEKTFAKSPLTDGQWVTMSRTVLNYNDLDSLFGEMVYEYDAFGKPIKYKVVHSYDPISHKKTKIVRFDPKGNPVETTTFKYDEKNQLKNITIHAPGQNFSKKTTYLYRNGQLWQIHIATPDYKIEKIYKNHRLVRRKEYDKNGLLLWFTDYQYIDGKR